ncbi:MAG TPA: hypothetical protein VF240_14345, partial [Pyrinomonadaceae bacterium]
AAQAGGVAAQKAGAPKVVAHAGGEASGAAKNSDLITKVAETAGHTAGRVARAVTNVIETLTGGKKR